MSLDLELSGVGGLKEKKDYDINAIYYRHQNTNINKKNWNFPNKTTKNEMNLKNKWINSFTLFWIIIKFFTI